MFHGLEKKKLYKKWVCILNWRKSITLESPSKVELMAEAQYSQNHTIDPSTGFIESNGSLHAFDADRKAAFLKNYRANGLRLRNACRQMGLSEATVNKHVNIDPVFREAFEAVEKDYLEDLESTSKSNGLNPRSVVERIFLLKCLLPEKYGQENRPQNTNITLSVDGKTLDLIARRSEVIEAVEIRPVAISDDKSL